MHEQEFCNLTEMWTVWFQLCAIVWKSLSAYFQITHVNY